MLDNKSLISILPSPLMSNNLNATIFTLFSYTWCVNPDSMLDSEVTGIERILWNLYTRFPSPSSPLFSSSCEPLSPQLHTLTYLRWENTPVFILLWVVDLRYLVISFERISWILLLITILFCPLLGLAWRWLRYNANWLIIVILFVLLHHLLFSVYLDEVKSPCSSHL